MLFIDNVGSLGGGIILEDLLISPALSFYECGVGRFKRFFNDCSSTSGGDIVWTFSKLPGPRIIVQCNEVTVEDASDEKCWRDPLVKIIIYTNYTLAFYRPKPGNKRVTSPYKNHV